VRVGDAAVSVPPPLALALVGLAALVVGCLAVTRVVASGERVVVSRLGRDPLVKGPGVVVVLPVCDRAWRVSLQEQCLDLLVLDEVTRDGVPVTARAVALVQVRDAVRYALAIDQPQVAAATLVESSLRGHVRGVALKDLLDVEGETTRVVSPAIQDALHEWGMHASAVEITRVELQGHLDPRRRRPTG